MKNFSPASTVALVILGALYWMLYTAGAAAIIYILFKIGASL